MLLAFVAANRIGHAAASRGRPTEPRPETALVAQLSRDVRERLLAFTPFCLSWGAVRMVPASIRISRTSFRAVTTSRVARLTGRPRGSARRDRRKSRAPERPTACPRRFPRGCRKTAAGRSQDPKRHDRFINELLSTRTENGTPGGNGLRLRRQHRCRQVRSNSLRVSLSAPQQGIAGRTDQEDLSRPRASR